LAFETHCTKHKYQKAIKAGFSEYNQFNIEQDSGLCVADFEAGECERLFWEHWMNVR
jgi:hypothetical protein